ncbi:hypothetical protein [Sphingomonas sp. DT-204]|uniref:hypothetical protein n=1 Tax=Sphingomonas sp. DT-204 TaxID=3396166 RepID=UPI003F197AB3
MATGHAPRTAPRAAVFAITADRCAQVLSRLLGLIAQQDRVVEWAQVECSARTCRVSLAVHDIDSRRAEIIAEKMRGLVKVRTVRLRLAAPRRREPITDIRPA